MAIWDIKGSLDSVGLGKRVEQKRSFRVADAIKKELALLLLEKVRDPRLEDVYISRVESTDDLKIARIYFTVSGDDKVRRAAELALEKAKGFMRSHLAKTLNMRFTPSLEFKYDHIAKKVEEMDKLFQEIAMEDKGEEGSS